LEVSTRVVEPIGGVAGRIVSTLVGVADGGALAGFRRSTESMWVTVSRGCTTRARPCESTGTPRMLSRRGNTVGEDDETGGAPLLRGVVTGLGIGGGGGATGVVYPDTGGYGSGCVVYGDGVMTVVGAGCPVA